MPAKSKKVQNNASFANTTFVQYRLNAQEKKDFATWKSQQIESLETLFVDMMQKGYKNSVTWDDKNDCWIGSTTCKDEGSPNHNMCLTSRSDGWYDSLLMNVFKTTELTNGWNWSDLDQDADLG